MTRYLGSSALLLVLVSANAQVGVAAGLDVSPYLSHTPRYVAERGPYAMRFARYLCHRALKHPPMPRIPFSLTDAAWLSSCARGLANTAALGKLPETLVCEERRADAVVDAMVRNRRPPSISGFMAHCEYEVRTRTWSPVRYLDASPRKPRHHTIRPAPRREAPPEVRLAHPMMPSQNPAPDHSRVEAAPRPTPPEHALHVRRPTDTPVRPYNAPAREAVGPVSVPPADPAVIILPSDFGSASSEPLEMLILIFALGAILYGLPRAVDGDDTETADPEAAGSLVSTPTVMAPAAGRAPIVLHSDLPSQDGWARRASAVRNPVTGFVFRFQARANAKALVVETARAADERELIKEYVALHEDKYTGIEAATRYAVRRDLAGEHYEHERAQQQEVFAAAAHRRRLAEKRFEKEAIEADTRTIEAQHEQEAHLRFKELKFEAGMARFEEKIKGRLVGAATADAAIAETKAPATPERGANDSNEVNALFDLLQSKMRAVEEGERLGHDTQGLREQIELYKKLLNLP